MLRGNPLFIVQQLPAAAPQTEQITARISSVVSSFITVPSMQLCQSLPANDAHSPRTPTFGDE
jgi:hypothetical protein